MFVFSAPVNAFTLRAGSSNFASGGTIHTVIRGYDHAYFSLVTVDYDIAVLEVGEPFALGTPGIAAVSLPEIGYYPAEGTIVYGSGWGTTTVSYSHSNIHI